LKFFALIEVGTLPHQIPTEDYFLKGRGVNISFVHLDLLGSVHDFQCVATIIIYTKGNKT
jgi:hypothetical protein